MLAQALCVSSALPGEDAQRRRVMNDTNASTGAVCLCSITRWRCSRDRFILHATSSLKTSIARQFSSYLPAVFMLISSPVCTFTVLTCSHWRRQLWGTCSLNFPLFNFFSVNFGAKTPDSDFVRLPLQTYLYSATAAVVVQSQLREPSSAYFFASFYVRRKVPCSFMPPSSHQILTMFVACVSNGICM